MRKVGAMRLTKMAGGVVVALVLGAFLGACNPESEPSGDVGTGPAEGEVVSVIAEDTFFEPESLDLTAGETVTVEITNEGSIVHDFSIEELDLNTGTIEPGAVVTATFEVPEGTTKFECTFHHQMEGTIEAS
jgi:plastocyanin